MSKGTIHVPILGKSPVILKESDLQYYVTNYNVGESVMPLFVYKITLTIWPYLSKNLFGLVGKLK